MIFVWKKARFEIKRSSHTYAGRTWTWTERFHIERSSKLSDDGVSIRSKTKKFTIDCTMPDKRNKHRITSHNKLLALGFVIAAVLLSFAATSEAFLVPSQHFSSVPVAFEAPFSSMALTMASEATQIEFDSFLSSIQFRPAAAEDIPRCFEIESASYPSDEAATMESLVNRQKYACDYFLLCTNNNGQDILGFICATRCHEFTEESMSALHDPTGPLLAVHSVVIDENYRRKGLATKLMNQYVQKILEHERDNQSATDTVPIASIVLLAKQHLLGFYVRCGYKVNRPSPIVHGKELWYDLEMELEQASAIRTNLLPRESWFCKTETFKSSLTFPEIKPHLDAHTKWVQDLRESGETCIVSGYRVDSDGKPGGGGLMFLAAKSYQEAYDLVAENDPLIVNGCVDWELNGWNGQVGGIRVE